MSISTDRQFVNATRVNKAFTADLERTLVQAVARRTPRAINSDHLTALALSAQLGAGVAYAASSRHPYMLWLVNFFLFANWLGDSLDGTLARVRNQQRPRYGFYVDHIVDTFGALALVVGLSCSNYIHWQIAAGMLVCFYILSIESYLATYTVGQFHLSQGVFGPTEIRILLAIGNACLLLHPCVSLLGHTVLLFDAAGVIAIVVMLLMAVAASVRHTAVLYCQERIR